MLDLRDFFDYPQIVWITLWTVGQRQDHFSAISAFMTD
jgi:hypothetical protein